MLASVPDERMPGGVTYLPGIVPRLTGTPGAILHSGGDLGADNSAIYGDFLGLSVRELEHLRTEGII
jgi:crotonobetainyl-CoA:carnitine CoA-transferase CaiB-like acyl-CoA transferase